MVTRDVIIDRTYSGATKFYVNLANAIDTSDMPLMVGPGTVLTNVPLSRCKSCGSSDFLGNRCAWCRTVQIG